jgi:hypothetical protein
MKKILLIMFLSPSILCMNLQSGSAKLFKMPAPRRFATYSTSDSEILRALAIFRETSDTVARLECAKHKKDIGDDIMGMAVTTPLFSYMVKALWVAGENTLLNHAALVTLSCIALGWPTCLAMHLVENVRKRTIEKQITQIDLPNLRKRLTSIEEPTRQVAQQLMMRDIEQKLSQENNHNVVSWHKIESVLAGKQ